MSVINTDAYLVRQATGLQARFQFSRNKNWGVELLAGFGHEVGPADRASIVRRQPSIDALGMECMVTPECAYEVGNFNLTI